MSAVSWASPMRLTNVWKSKYGGMEASDVQRLRDVEAEHAKLKRMYAELAMENHALKDSIEKNFRPGAQAPALGLAAGPPRLERTPGLCGDWNATIDGTLPPSTGTGRRGHYIHALHDASLEILRVADARHVILVMSPPITMKRTSLLMLCWGHFEDFGEKDFNATGAKQGEKWGINVGSPRFLWLPKVELCGHRQCQCWRDAADRHVEGLPWRHLGMFKITLRC